MKDINDKDYRMALIARYLEAETTVAEEALLAGYYAANKADDDETAVAEMVMMEHTDTPLLSRKGAKEYERIINMAPARLRKRSFHRLLWSGGIAAAVALMFFFSYGTREEPNPYAAFDTIELAEHMQQIMNLNMEDVTSIKASPVQECVLLKATLADGSTKTFVMSKSEEEGSTSFIAIN